MTGASADPERLTAARAAAEVIVVDGEALQAAAVVAALVSRGLTRIDCEGGPRLLAALSAAGLVDEADISFSPLLASGGQAATGAALPEPARFDLAHVIVDEGFLFTRYLARGHAANPPPAV
jgi:riboflavin biosynthesis pyrimidine reductase